MIKILKILKLTLFGVFWCVFASSNVFKSVYFRFRSSICVFLIYLSYIYLHLFILDKFKFILDKNKFFSFKTQIDVRKRKKMKIDEKRRFRNIR